MKAWLQGRGLPFGVPVQPRHGVAVFFLAWLVLGLCLVPDYGISWDEAAQRDHGIVAFDYLNKKLGLGLPIQKPRSHLERHPARHYGLWFPLTGYLLERALGLDHDVFDLRERFLLRHFLTFLLFWGASLAFYHLLYLRWKHRGIALLGVLMLLLSPRIFGHAFFNPKDSVFLSTYLIGCWTLLRLTERPTPGAAAAHAVAGAFALSTRIAGLALPALTLGWLFLLALRQKNYRLWAKRLALYLPLTAALALALSPGWWEQPLHAVGETVQTMANYPWNSEVLFRGAFIPATELPWYYIPWWMGISTPLPYVLLFGAGLLFVGVHLGKGLRRGVLWRDAGERMDLMLLSLSLLPWLAVVLRGSTLYDGWRQMQFIYPPMLALALGGAVFSWRALGRLPGAWKGVGRLALLLLLGGGMLHTAARMVKDHPLQHLYFNPLAGKDLLFRYDCDYWGLAYKEAILELGRRIPDRCVTFKAVHYPGEENWRFLEHRQPPNLDIAYGPEPAEFHLSELRWRYEQDRYRRREFPYLEEVFWIRVGGERMLGVFRDPRYEERLRRFIR